MRHPLAAVIVTVGLFTGVAAYAVSGSGASGPAADTRSPEAVCAQAEADGVPCDAVTFAPLVFEHVAVE